MPFVHGVTGVPVDVVLAGPGLEDQFFERAVIRDIDGLSVPVASSEDVVKILAGRPKDQEDVIAIVAAYGDAFDERAVRETLGQLEQALAQSDLIPAFEAALARVRRARSRP